MIVNFFFKLCGESGQMVAENLKLVYNWKG